MTCGNVKEYQFIGSLCGIHGSQFHRVAYLTDINKIDTLHGLSVSHVETGDDSFSQHVSNQYSVIGRKLSYAVIRYRLIGQWNYS